MIYRLPQSVLAHIYEYDPTYRVDEHQKQMQALKEHNLNYGYENDWTDVDYMDSFAFQFTMYLTSAAYMALCFPFIAMVCAVRAALITSGMVVERIFRVL